MHKYVALFFLFALPHSSPAHIGSPGVTFEGYAGNYHVMVLITPPDVIPGTATIDVYVQAGVTRITAKPVYWFAGRDGTPRADELLPVPGEPGHYQGLVWLMSSGTSSLEVEVTGEEGSGTILVPVMAVSTAQRSMDSSLAWTLLGLCIFLVALMVTIISASVSDGLVKPEEKRVVNVSRKRLVGAVTSFVILALILYGGKSWWDGWASSYRQFMYRPLTATSSVVSADGASHLVFKVDTVRPRNLQFTRRLSYLVPDHGKIMHMFLVRAGTMDVFAHLHPKRQDTLTFTTPLPPLLPGRYLVFADVTRLSGFSETIADTLEIPGPVLPMTFASYDSAYQDRDDTFFLTNAIGSTGSQGLDNIVICGKPGVITPLADGSTIVWEKESSDPFRVGKLYSLTYSVVDPAGNPALLEPYLGMLGHAVVMKDDGSVYIHLHPVGNYSMASQQVIIDRFNTEGGPVKWDELPGPRAFADSIDRVVARLDAMSEEERNGVLMRGMVHYEDDPEHEGHSIVRFPYAFPSPGNYRIWIQMKREGRILNSAFDVRVE